MSKTSEKQCDDKCFLNTQVIKYYRKYASKEGKNKHTENFENKVQKNKKHETKLKATSVLETNKDKIQTWNHLAWRREAKAARHFCLSRTSGGSMTESVSIGRWNKKTRYSLTKGSSVSRPGGPQAGGGRGGDPSTGEPQNALNLPLIIS